MEKKSISRMLDRTPSLEMVMRIDPAKPGAEQMIYFCSACRRVIRRMNAHQQLTDAEKCAMSTNHKCSSPGKSDFEDEVR